MTSPARHIRIGIIGGTGLEDILTSNIGASGIEEVLPETPFGRPSAPIVACHVGEVEVALLKRHGEGHVYNPARVPCRANVCALKQLGCTHIIATGATGSLREAIEPGDLVLCDQLIDKTDDRPKTFFDRAAVHVEFADPFCPVMRRWLLEASTTLSGYTIHDGGTYLCMEGPSFSTRAESHMHRAWGADVVGMTALPEARLAREAEMAYALIALPTDYDCWRERKPGQDDASLLEEIIDNIKRASAASIDMIKAALRDVSILRETPSQAHDALRLAIWSKKSAIDLEEVERLAPLWGRYFDDGASQPEPDR
jgi:5'-methylthioadenosine phosphorylase